MTSPPHHSGKCGASPAARRDSRSATTGRGPIRVGGQLVELDRGAEVRFLREGVKLNLGSIGKGYAADRCGQLLQAAGIHDFLVNADGSSVLAHGGSMGDAPAPPPAPHWLVGVPPSYDSQPTARRTAAAESSLRHLGHAVPIFLPSRAATTEYSRPAPAGPPRPCFRPRSWRPRPRGATPFRRPSS